MDKPIVYYVKCTIRIRAISVCRRNRIIIAIRKHIAAEDALAGGGEAVCIDKSADLRIVITALEVIESRLLSVGLAKDAKNGSICR